MRVLKKRILVEVCNTSSDPLVSTFDHIREGIVQVSGSDQIKEKDKVIFGEVFEEVSIKVTAGMRYLLMEQENVKIIFDTGDKIPETNVLPFMKKVA